MPVNNRPPQQNEPRHVYLNNAESTELFRCTIEADRLFRRIDRSNMNRRLKKTDWLEIHHRFYDILEDLRSFFQETKQQIDALYPESSPTRKEQS